MSRRFAFLSLAYCAFIFYLSSLPLQITEKIPIPQIDKVAHLGLYGGLTWCVAMTLRRAKRPYSPAALFWIPVVFAALYGWSDEFHQSFVPHREYDVLDILSDAMGGLFMQCVLCLWWWRIPVSEVIPFVK